MHRLTIGLLLRLMIHYSPSCVHGAVCRVSEITSTPPKLSMSLSKKSKLLVFYSNDVSKKTWHKQAERYSMHLAFYQAPLKSLSTLESLQGNGSKVLECNPEPGHPFTESWSRSWIFNTGSHFRMSQDGKGRVFCTISTEQSPAWRRFCKPAPAKLLRRTV